MAGIAAKVLDRFRPGIFDRLKQSKEAKAQRRNVAPPKTQTAIDIETRAQQFSPKVWREWNTMPTATTSCCNTLNTWSIWQDQGTAGTTTGIWNAWTTNQVIIRTSNIITTSNMAWDTWQTQEQPRFNGNRRLTAAERRSQEEQEAKWRAEEAARSAKYREEELERARKKKEADDRAMALLVSMLNDQQRADLKRDKHFYVDAPSGRLYRIDYGTHGNVKVVDRMSRKIIERLCIQPNGVPAGDANLMQKLLIETAEETFRAHANITLEDGRMVYGKSSHLDNVELAKVIPIRRAA